MLILSRRISLWLLCFATLCLLGCSGKLGTEVASHEVPNKDSPAQTAAAENDVDDPDVHATDAQPRPNTAGSALTDRDLEEHVPFHSASADERASNEPLMLGSDELTRGIPGEGPLTIEQIQDWLDDPRNHKPLEVQLPIGLSAGAGAMRIPDDNPFTRAKIELGRQLYFDRRLSSDATISCADCHHPDNGFARNTRFGVGIRGQEGNRNSPISYNRILSDAQFWDGRAESLEAQAIGPIANPIEMGNTHEVCCSTIGDIEAYRLQFERIFPDGVTIENIGRAIASFERVIVTNTSPADYYEQLRAMQVALPDYVDNAEALKEDDPELYEQYLLALKQSEEHPMSESAKRGRELFFGQRGGCTACHVGANYTDEKYHNLGVGMDHPDPDLGRFVVTGDEKDRGAFKTPTVRNVALTAPYMHDGSQQTLMEVVEWYDKGGHPNPNLSPDVRRLDLTLQEKQDLVAFMEALTGTFPRVETARLPP